MSAMLSDITAEQVKKWIRTFEDKKTDLESFEMVYTGAILKFVSPDASRGYTFVDNVRSLTDPIVNQTRNAFEWAGLIVEREFYVNEENVVGFIWRSE